MICGGGAGASSRGAGVSVSVVVMASGATGGGGGASSEVEGGRTGVSAGSEPPPLLPRTMNAMRRARAVPATDTAMMSPVLPFSPLSFSGA